MTQDKYTNERIIGHHISAERVPWEVDGITEALVEALDIEPRQRPDRILITEGDVNWSSTNEVTITSEELKAMAVKFTDLSE